MQQQAASVVKLQPAESSHAAQRQWVGCARTAVGYMLDAILCWCGVLNTMCFLLYAAHCLLLQTGYLSMDQARSLLPLEATDANVSQRAATAQPRCRWCQHGQGQAQFGVEGYVPPGIVPLTLNKPATNGPNSVQACNGWPFIVFSTQLGGMCCKANADSARAGTGASTGSGTSTVSCETRNTMAC